MYNNAIIRIFGVELKHQTMEWISVIRHKLEVGTEVYLHGFDYGIYEGTWFLNDDLKFYHVDSCAVFDWDTPPDHYCVVPELPPIPTR